MGIFEIKIDHLSSKAAISRTHEHFGSKIKSEEKKRDMFKNWPLIKNPHFLSNPHETW